MPLYVKVCTDFNSLNGIILFLLVSSDRLYSFTLAIQNLSKWSLDSNSTAVLTYTFGLKTVSVSMVCSRAVQDEFEILGENPANHYSMRLRSRCACWNGCKTPTPSTTPSRKFFSFLLKLIKLKIQFYIESSPATSGVIYYSACMYHDSRYGTIDLSSIGSMTGTPTFKDVPTKYSSNFVWSYNPCYTFSEMSCHNVAGCQSKSFSIQNFTSFFFSLSF